MAADPSTTQSSPTTDLDVKERYSAAAIESEAALCCPVSYNPEFLKAIPDEIIEKDYGCGDPSPFVNPGETVLDLGSGGGKLCYIASQIVGKAGLVIGVDYNPDMLSLARKYQEEMGIKLGFQNTDFRCGRIQDLKLNLELLAKEWGGRPIKDHTDWVELHELEQRLRVEQPLVKSNSVDCVVSNCVLNLVVPEDRRQLFREIHRILKVGGRAAISDIVSDELVPEEMQNDGHLWSGCISGAWREDDFIEEFRNAGFQGIEIAKLEAQPWQVVNGIEFRSMTVVAYKMDDGPCLEKNQAVIYRGPFPSVMDDDGHTYPRGKRVAVCGRTFETLMAAPFQGQFIAVEPADKISDADAKPFDCTTDQLRDPKVTKGATLSLPIAGCCDEDNCC